MRPRTKKKKKTKKEEKLERRGFLANNVGFDPLLVSMKKRKDRGQKKKNLLPLVIHKILPSSEIPKMKDWLDTRIWDSFPLEIGFTRTLRLNSFVIAFNMPLFFTLRNFFDFLIWNGLCSLFDWLLRNDYYDLSLVPKVFPVPREYHRYHSVHLI